MNIILESERDRRTFDWLVEQVGEEAVERACKQLAGKRKPYASNLAKALGLIPPESLSRPTKAEVQNLLARNGKYPVCMTSAR